MARHVAPECSALCFLPGCSHSHHHAYHKTENDSCPRSVQHGPRANPPRVAEEVNAGASVLDEVEVIRILSKGRGGTLVFLIKRKMDQTLYGMKMIPRPNDPPGIRRQRTRIWTERRVLAKVKHPFIVSLHYAFQTEKHLFFVLDYCPGGELFALLQKLKRLPQGLTRLYMAELLLALEHLHGLGILYRDLKPENILLDGHGHLRLVDFDLAKESVRHPLYGATTLCGTPEYMAPEILQRSRYGTAIDWWSFGVVLFELLAGYLPWCAGNNLQTFRQIVNTPLVLPPSINKVGGDLIRKLLDKDPRTRLGSGNGASEIKQHPFFAGIDFERLPSQASAYKPYTAALNLNHADDPSSCLLVEGTNSVNFPEILKEKPLEETETLGGEDSQRPSSARALKEKEEFDHHPLFYEGFTYATPSIRN